MYMLKGVSKLAPSPTLTSHTQYHLCSMTKLLFLYDIVHFYKSVDQIIKLLHGTSQQLTILKVKYSIHVFSQIYLFYCVVKIIKTIENWN